MTTATGHYPEFEQVRAAATQRARGFVDPARLTAAQERDTRRDWDWCTAVLGREYRGLRSASSVEAHMLDVAEELGLTPPLAPETIAARHAAAEQRRIEDDRRAAIDRRREQEWATALGTCGVQVEVRPNVNTGIHGNRREALHHVVPLADARGKRTHPAGRALCDTGRRARPLGLGEPTTAPATCHRCVTAAATLRADATSEGR